MTWSGWRESVTPLRGRGGKGGKRRSSSAETRPRPLVSALDLGARARVAARSLTHFLLYSYRFFTLFSWLE